MVFLYVAFQTAGRCGDWSLFQETSEGNSFVIVDITDHKLLNISRNNRQKETIFNT